MKKNKVFKNPFKNLKLDAEEQAIEDAIESGKMKSLGLTLAEKNRLAKYARYTLERRKMNPAKAMA